MQNHENKGLTQAIDEFNSDYSKGGADWFQHFATDATIFGPGSTEPLKGRAAYEKNFKNLLTKEKRRMEVLKRDFHVTGDTAVVMQVLQVTQSQVETILRETTIWRQEDGTWRIIHMDASAVGVPRSTEAIKDLRTVKILREKMATVSSQVGVAQ